MYKLLTGLTAAAILGVVLAFTITRLTAQPDPLAYSQRLFEQQQAQQAAQQAAADAARLRPVVYVMRAAWYLTLAVAPLALLVVALDTYRRRAAPLVRPDARGLLPVARGALETGELKAVVIEALAAYHHTQALAASHQPIAHHLTYSPKGVPALSGQQDAPQALPVAAALPDTAPLGDYLARVTPGHIALGVAPDGALLQLPFATCYHALLSGDTRTGKTNALDGVIVQLHYMARRMPLTLYAADYKQELLATWRRSALFAHGIQTDPAAIADLLGALVEGQDGVRARYAHFAAYGEETGRVIRNIGDYARARGETPRMAVLILDELNALLGAAKKDTNLATMLKQLLQIGAGAGIYVIGGAQYLSAATFGRDGSKQFVTRATFGAFDPIVAGMLFGRGVEETTRAYMTGIPGRGLIRTAHTPQPTAFQALLCEERDIIDAVAVARSGAPARGAPMTASERATSASERPRSALQVVGGNGPVAPASRLTEAPVAPVAVSERERRAILDAAREPGPDGQPPSRRLVCQRVYNAPGGAGYSKVRAVLDAARL